MAIEVLLERSIGIEKYFSSRTRPRHTAACAASGGRFRQELAHTGLQTAGIPRTNFH